MTEKDIKTGLWIRFIAGGCSDMFATLFTHSIDVVKVRMQLIGESSGFSAQGPREFAKIYKNIYTYEGITKGLYRGLSAALLRHMTFSTTRHGTFAYLQQITNNDNGKNSMVKSIGCGLIAGICGSVIGSPIDLILVRMQADAHWPVNERRNYKNVFDGLFRVINEERFINLWTGCGPMILRASVLTSVQLPVYYESKELLSSWKYFPFNKEHTITHLLASISAAFSCSFCSAPIDLIKTRLMNMKKQAVESHGEAKNYKGVLDCVIKTVKHEGVLGLWAGILPQFLRLAPHNIILWLSVEQITRILVNIDHSLLH